MISKSVPARSGSRTFATGVEYITEHEHQRALVAVGTSFGDRVEYAGAEPKAAWVHLRGVTSVATAAIEMEAVAGLSTRCEDPVYHLIVAYAKNEHPTREQVIADAERLLAALHMEDHQYVLSAHQDTDDFHAHVIANRVGPDGRASDLWRERVIRERVCAEIAAERGWEIVRGHHNRDIVQRVERLHAMPEEPARRMSDAAYRHLRERGERPWEESARQYILDAVDRAQSWDELHARLDAHGVVLKLVVRGDQVQGLAFAEGRGEHAPGCAASRIDARCALAALQRRFGAFTPLREADRSPSPGEAVARGERAVQPERSQSWSDEKRALILGEVEAARSWAELIEGLGRHGIVVKLVQRGGYVQGLAFAEGESPEAPGCGASRIDPRCKKAALEERFGAFPGTTHDRASEVRGARPRKAERLDAARERHRAAEREADVRRAERQNAGEPQQGSPSERVIHAAEGIAEHARMRAEYTAYRQRLGEERRRANSVSYDRVWERERAQRELEAQRRSEARNMLRAVARVGSRGPVRQVAYWTIDAVIKRRREREYAAARARWAAAKAIVAAERGLDKEEQPKGYEAFVAERARRGDRSAQRVHADLTRPIRPAATARVPRTPESHPRTAEPAVQERSRTIDEVRTQLGEMRRAEQARYERAAHEWEALVPVEEPDLSDELEEREAAIRAEAETMTAFNEDEARRLQQLAAEQHSWNPLARAAAAKREHALRMEQQRRCEVAIQDALQRFHADEAVRIKAREAAERRRYEQYVERAYALETEVNGTTLAQQRLRTLEHDVAILERAGVARIDGIGEQAKLRDVDEAIARGLRRIPDEQRRMIEERLRSEELARTRESRGMDER